ncbi:MAG: acetylxylan esterase, partial [Duncaniella sp.]|nr:acetylxylan esterase [Duncaniella sp.]
MKIFRLSTLIILVALFFRVSAVENYPYRADGLWVTVPDHNDWIYEIGEDASVDVEFYLYGMPVDAAVVRYEIGDDMMPADTRGEFTLKNGKGKVAMGTMRKPGFRDLRLSAEIEGKKFEHHIKLGFSPDRLAPFVNEPSDFGEFWAKAVAEDKKYPLTYSVEPVEEYSTDKMSCSLVRLQLNAEGRSMYGYLFIPKGDGKYPAVLCPPGAGVKTIKDPMRHRYYGEGGMIRAEIEIHGQHPAQTE